MPSPATLHYENGGNKTVTCATRRGIGVSVIPARATFGSPEVRAEEPRDVRDGVINLRRRVVIVVVSPISPHELTRVLADWCPPFSGYHLYYPSRRQLSLAFTLLVDALRFKKGEANNRATRSTARRNHPDLRNP